MPARESVRHQVPCRGRQAAECLDARGAAFCDARGVDSVVDVNFTASPGKVLVLRD
jgi:hypothetical protein